VLFVLGLGQYYGLTIGDAGNRMYYIKQEGKNMSTLTKTKINGPMIYKDKWTVFQIRYVSKHLNHSKQVTECGMLTCRTAVTANTTKLCYAVREFNAYTTRDRHGNFKHADPYKEKYVNQHCVCGQCYPFSSNFLTDRSFMKLGTGIKQVVATFIYVSLDS
jgi:hypothetical protein